MDGNENHEAIPFRYRQARNRDEDGNLIVTTKFDLPTAGPTAGPTDGPETNRPRHNMDDLKRLSTDAEFVPMQRGGGRGGGSGRSGRGGEGGGGGRANGNAGGGRHLRLNSNVAALKANRDSENRRNAYFFEDDRRQIDFVLAYEREAVIR